MTGQLEVLWKPEVKSGAPEGTRHDVPYVVSRNETYSWQQYHGLQMSLAIVVTETRKMYLRGFSIVHVTYTHIPYRMDADFV